MTLVLAQLALCCLVSGQVKTPSGAPVSNAVVTAISSKGSGVRALTGGDGAFSIRVAVTVRR